MGKISLLNSLYSRYFLWLSWNWPRDCEIVHCGSPSWYVSRFSSMFPYFRKSRDRSRELPDWGNRICKTLPNTSQDCYDSISMLKCQNADFRKIRKKSKKMKNVFIENRFFQNELFGWETSKGGCSQPKSSVIAGDRCSAGKKRRKRDQNRSNVKNPKKRNISAPARRRAKSSTDLRSVHFSGLEKYKYVQLYCTETKNENKKEKRRGLGLLLSPPKVAKGEGPPDILM